MDAVAKMGAPLPPASNPNLNKDSGGSGGGDITGEIQGLVDKFAQFSVKQFGLQLKNSENSLVLSGKSNEANGYQTYLSKIQTPQ